MSAPATLYALPNPTGTYPDLRDYHERVGRALVQVIALAHRVAFRAVEGQPIDTLADLRALPSKLLDTNDNAAPDLARVGGQDGNLWAWYRYSVEPDSATCVRPLDVEEDKPGRWSKQRLPIGIDCGSLRYLAHVEYCANQLTDAMLIDRCRGKFPALFVSLVDDDISKHETQTYRYHRIEANYRLRILTANYHGGVQARFPGPNEPGQDGDPGSQRIIGDVRQVLIYDNRLMRCPGVVKTTLGNMSASSQRDAERVIFDAVNVRVAGYTETPNTPCEVLYPWQFWVQLQELGGENAGPPVQVPGYGQSA